MTTFMASPTKLLFFFFFTAAVAAAAAVGPARKKKTYIVHMAKHMMPSSFSNHADWYDSSLRATVSDDEDTSMLYTYDVAAHGFAAKMTSKAARALKSSHGVLSVLPDSLYELHTTRSPEFMGLAAGGDSTLVPQASSGSHIIVGVLDTGVWPERRSFDDSGFDPTPSNWKGFCETGTNFTSNLCNRKLIGARFFCNGYEAAVGKIDEGKESRSPRDDDGHGTHTATTAAGAVVSDANLLGFAAGTARGMSTGARVAAYKCCWLGGCFSSDILAAIDSAVSDGCHVLSLSLGGGASDYFRDSVAIGAFGAMEKGILVSCSAGNAGPSASSLSNLAPWITTVGAGTIDRDFPAIAVLGNGENYTGVSLYGGNPLPSSLLPVIYAGNASNATNGNLCMTGTLVPDLVNGKVVLCDRGVNSRVQKGAVVKAAGAAAMILANTAANGEELVADAHLLPATAVGEKAGDAIRAYVAKDPNPTATIVFAGTKLGISPSPMVAAFSSRGPNPITPEILKPDLIAPGVNILAGWTGAAGPTGLPVDSRRVEFNIISGTSMSCPHVSGLAALLMEAHPDWSPAAVRSALMTTAYDSYSATAGGGGILDVATGNPATPFDIGAGHVDPVRALDPGLVYDLSAVDYLSFLCALNYTALQLSSMVKRGSFKCEAGKSYSVSELNYPSFEVTFPAAVTATVRHLRTLTNVGSPGTYKVTVTAAEAGDGSSVKAVVEPEELVFSDTGERRSFAVSFTAASLPSGSTGFGRLVWSDGNHVVGSPIAYTWT